MAWREQEVDCAIHFGDVLDGFHPKAESLSALKTIVAEFDLVAKPHYHMIGNHCLYNLPRQVPMISRASMSAPGFFASGSEIHLLAGVE